MKDLLLVLSPLVALLGFFAARDPLGRQVARARSWIELADSLGSDSEAAPRLRDHAEVEARQVVRAVRKRRDTVRRRRRSELTLRWTMGTLAGVTGILAILPSDTAAERLQFTSFFTLSVMTLILSFWIGFSWHRREGTALGLDLPPSVQDSWEQAPPRLTLGSDARWRKSVRW
jgi:hypothetical protein